MRLIIFFILVLACVPVAMGQAVTSFSGGAQYNSYYGGVIAGDVIGWRFTVNQQIEVSDLGVWNNDTAGAGGMDTPHPVGIWDESQTLICSVTVDVTGTIVGDWIYGSITPLILNTGETYTIGVEYYSDDDDSYISSASSMSTDPDVTWVNAVYPLEGDLGFVFPVLDSAASSLGRFGPNFLFSETALEQSTWGSIKATF